MEELWMPRDLGINSGSWRVCGTSLNSAWTVKSSFSALSHPGTMDTVTPCGHTKGLTQEPQSPIRNHSRGTTGMSSAVLPRLLLWGHQTQIMDAKKKKYRKKCSRDCNTPTKFDTIHPLHSCQKTPYKAKTACLELELGCSILRHTQKPAGP